LDNELRLAVKIRSCDGLVVDWAAGQVRGKEYPDGLTFQLEVSWQSVEDAVKRVEAQRRREASRALAKVPKPALLEASSVPSQGGSPTPSANESVADDPTLAPVADQALTGEQVRMPSTGPSSQDEAPPPNKSGRKPEKRAAAIAEMVEAVNQGKLTREALQEIPKKKLGEHFTSAKTTTLFFARKEALRQLARKGIPTES
jgi:hypothetical protein